VVTDVTFNRGMIWKNSVFVGNQQWWSLWHYGQPFKISFSGQGNFI